MLFNTYNFIFIFLPIAFIGFYFLAKINHKYAAAWLAFISLCFYSIWNPYNLIILLISIVLNFSMGITIQKQAEVNGKQSSKPYLILGVMLNLLVLAYFKYFNFFLDTSNQLFDLDWHMTNVILPLGISFFTFTQIAYLVDVQRSIVREYNFIHYLLFVSYFPHLIAGPIIHHKQMMPQFSNPETYRLKLDNINPGLIMFSIGLFKKVVLADLFSEYATPFFTDIDKGLSSNFFDSWVGVLSYTLQLYFDFSGYTDMAIGMSKLFNIDLPLNFNSPYKAKNIIEFWRCWHMTLSTFLRDYLYIPLGGNRHGQFRRLLNILITMLLGGLWHGASWNFVLWGGLHGFYLIINHSWENFRTKYQSPKILGLDLFYSTLTFLAVTIAWVPFRASDLASTVKILKYMFGYDGITLPYFLQPIQSLFFKLLPEASIAFTAISSKKILFYLIIGLVIVRFAPNSQTIGGLIDKDLKNSVVSYILKPCTLSGIIFGTVCFIALMLIVSRSASEFLYFQF